MVFVKISLLKHVIRFRALEKLASRFVGHFSILKRIRMLSYGVDLPKRMAEVHNVFHVSHLSKCVHNPSTIIESSQLEDMDVGPNMARPQGPINILEYSTKRLRDKMVKLS